MSTAGELSEGSEGGGLPRRVASNPRAGARRLVGVVRKLRHPHQPLAPNPVRVARNWSDEMAVLVLNATYEPLHVVSLRRAVVLLLKEKAEVVEATDAVLRSERLTMAVPLVIRLVRYVRIPYRLGPPLTRRTVLLRDRYTCQYCGSQPGKAALTVDHVLPRCRGGQTTWDNVVAACRSCNQRKGRRTPEEAGMTLLARPSRPRYGALVLLGAAGADPAWTKYMS